MEASKPLPVPANIVHSVNKSYSPSVRQGLLFVVSWERQQSLSLIHTKEKEQDCDYSETQVHLMTSMGTKGTIGVGSGIMEMPVSLKGKKFLTEDLNDFLKTQINNINTSHKEKRQACQLSYFKNSWLHSSKCWFLMLNPTGTDDDKNDNDNKIDEDFECMTDVMSSYIICFIYVPPKLWIRGMMVTWQTDCCWSMGTTQPGSRLQWQLQELQLSLRMANTFLLKTCMKMTM